MYQNYGEIFKRLREDKGLPRTVIAKDILSPQALSQFESGNSMVSVDKFHALIRKLNITAEEFFSGLTNQYPDNQANFIGDYTIAIETKNHLILEKLIENETKFYKKSGNVRHQHNILLAQARRLKILNQTIPIHMGNELASYLFEINEWYYYEISLFNNSMFLFTLEQLLYLAKFTIDRMANFSEMFSYKNITAHFYLNIVNELLKYDELILISNYLREVKNIIDRNPERFYEKMRLTYFEGLYQIKSGNVEQGVMHAKKAINTLLEFGYHEKAKQFNEGLTTITTI